MTVDFYWDTKISKERQDQIRAWVASLSPDEQSMLEELLRDTREAERFDLQESIDVSESLDHD